MAKKVGQLTAQTTPSGSSLVVISEGGVSKKTTIDQITAAAEARMEAEIDLKATANPAITAKTATKITYDEKGFVTSGTSATTADIDDTTDRRYVSDLEKAFLTDQVDLFDGDGNIVLTQPGAGVIMESPSGEEFKLSVNDDGAFVDMSGFVTVRDGKFWLHGHEYRGVGFNYYTLAWAAKSSITQIMDHIVGVGGNEIRFWAFDQLNPSDSDGNFHFLDYPLDDPELMTDASITTDFEAGTTGWTLSGDFTRSSEDSHTGSYSIKQVSAGGYNEFTSDEITVTPGSNYTLTFYYKRISQGGFGPYLNIRKGSDGSQLYDGGLLEQTGPDDDDGWQRKQINFNVGAESGIKVRIQNFSGSVTFYYDDFWLNLQGAPLLGSRESQFRLLDFVADEARKRGLKLVPSFADNTTNYNTKLTYIRWANAISGAGASTGFPYIGFFNNGIVKQLYKDVIAEFLNRENTINGMIYKEDPTFKNWELGNELRLDRSDPSGVNTPSSANIALLSGPGGWADEMSTHIVETLGAKQLVTFGSMAHGYDYRAGDSVFNGSYYGVDYRVMALLPYIHFLDFHLYTTQDALTTDLYPMGETDIVSFGQFVAGKAAPIKKQGSGTSYALPLNAATLAGDDLLVTLTFGTAQNTEPTITDAAGNTYTRTSVSNGNKTHKFSGPQTTGGVTTLNIAWPTSSSYTFYVDEISGRENENNARSREGLEAQLLHYITTGKNAGKPATITEHGYSIDINNRNNYHYPLQPRLGAFDAIFEFWFRNGGAQIDLWSATITGGGSYSVNLGDRDQPDVTDNSNDTKVNALIRYWNEKLRHHEVRSLMDQDLKYTLSEIVPRTFDGDYEGIVHTGVTGESLSFGHLVYLDSVTETWKKAGALLHSSRFKKLGMCAVGAGSGESTKILILGTIRADSLFPTFNVGYPVYMSETAGLVSTAKPTTSGAVHRVVGYADSADQMTFQPDGNFGYVS